MISGEAAKWDSAANDLISPKRPTLSDRKSCYQPTCGSSDQILFTKALALGICWHTIPMAVSSLSKICKSHHCRGHLDHFCGTGTSAAMALLWNMMLHVTDEKNGEFFVDQLFQGRYLICFKYQGPCGSGVLNECITSYRKLLLQVSAQRMKITVKRNKSEIKWNPKRIKTKQNVENLYF